LKIKFFNNDIFFPISSVVLGLFFFFSYPAIVQGQKIDLKFQRIFEGLTNNRVSAIHQDDRGFIWVGTYSGLHRYDGIDFEVYATNTDSSSINDNYIGSIFEDSKNRLWIGTGNGIALYNRKTDDFRRFKLQSQLSVQKGESNLVNTILEDEQGTIWASSTVSGLFYLDVKSEEFVPFYPEKINRINAIAADKGNILWIATAYNGLLKVNTSNGNTKHFQHEPTNPHSLSSNELKTVTIDRDGNIWAGTTTEGLNKAVKNNSELSFVRYRNEPGNPNSLFNNNIYRLYVDKNGNLWTCNENGGLHLYDKENDAFHRYINDPKNPNSLTHNSVWSIFQDNLSRYWVGTAQSGINLADPHGSKFTHYFKNTFSSESLNNDIVRDFWEDKNENIWVATDGGGLNFFDRKSETFKAFKNDKEIPYSLASDAVISLNEDQEGNLWVGTWDGGLNILKEEQNRKFISFQQWINNFTYPIKHVFDVHFDSNYIWVAAFEEGLYRYDKKSADLKLFSALDKNPNSLSSNQTIRIFEDSRKNLWIGTQFGLNKVLAEDKEKVKFKVYHPSESEAHSIPSSSIRQILEDSKQSIWVATDRGLAKYRPESDDFVTYSENEGLPTGEINSIVEDDKGFLWIGTIKGISKFDPVKEQFANYDKFDGLQGNEFSRYSVLKTKKGELLFGGLNGFNLFHPGQLVSNPYAPPVFLTDLKIFNQSVNIKSPESPLKVHISSADTLMLSYKENVFTFDFVALDYTSPEQVQYAYILEGFEKDWNYVGKQRNATYTNLNPGTYTLRVKAANSDGVWNEAGTSLVLIITPPFWKTAWFIVLCTICAVVCLVGFFKLRLRSIQNQNKLLEKTVEERTTMLKHANVELKKHINERDKLFSIIGHDLRNPFVSIIGYLEILEEDFENDQNKEQLKNIRYLLNVSRNTHNLLENLLQWASKKNKVYEVKAEVIHADKLVEIAVNMVSSQAIYKGINLVKSCPADLLVYADKNMLLTVLRNLISNAIKFSKKGSKIEITVKEESGNVITSVRDYGIGMEKEVLKRLFSKSDVQKPGTLGEFGTGLGLVLCQEMVQKHHGKIWAESIPEEGSTFHFSLAKYELEEVAV
jgi:ligand-binding sensor domain-containing protein/signal transduction histidine kinase